MLVSNMASEKLIGEEHGYLQMHPDDEPPAGAGGGGETGMRQRKSSVNIRYRHERLPCADDNVDKNFFAWGRDFESVNTAHKFLSHEREKMATFEANNYYPQNSQVYRKHLADQDAQGIGKKSWDAWVAMGLIGICMGFISFFVRQTVDVIGESKYKIVESYAKEGEWAAVWGIGVGYSVGFILVSVLLVIFIEPAAASSGIPEVIAFLNGVHVPKIFNIKTLIVKFFSVICSVGYCAQIVGILDVKLNRCIRYECLMNECGLREIQSIFACIHVCICLFGIPHLSHDLEQEIIASIISGGCV